MTVPYVQHAGIRNGANQEDVNEIYRRFEAGETAEVIALALNIQLPCIETFAPKEIAKQAKAIEKKRAEALKKDEADKGN